MSGFLSGGTASAVPPPEPGAPTGLQAVLFDMDGLLVDSEPLWFESERIVMARMDSDWTAADQEYLIGGSLDHSVSYMISKAVRPAPPEVVGRWLLGTMADMVRDRGVVFKPGATRLLAEVTEAGIPCALVTSTERPIMKAIIEATGMTFGVTVCGDDVSRRKPDPEPYLLGASLLGVSPECCVALDDSPTGVASAEAAGCVVVAVPSVPMPPRPGRLTVSSLADLSVAALRRLVPA